MAEFLKIVSGTISIPINLPNTNYQCGLNVISLAMVLSHRIGVLIETDFVDYDAGKEEHYQNS